MFQIHAVTNDQSSESIESLSERIIALSPFVDFVQIREKSRSPQSIAQLIELISNHVDTAKLIINDRADIALAMGLSRVHLTESSLSLSQLQNVFPILKFGRSFHAVDPILSHLHDYDYGYIGHIFPTALKTYPPFGLTQLRALATQRKQGRLIAIGGIDETNITEVAPLVDGIAVMSGFFAKSIEDSIEHACNLHSLALNAITERK